MADAPTSTPPETVIRVRGLRTQFGTHVIHEDLDLDVYRGEALGIVGASGSGKSVLMRAIVGLVKPVGGRIEMFGADVTGVGPEAAERHWGVLFQNGALFSSMTVAENVMVPLREHVPMSRALMEEIAAYKIDMVGLPADAGVKYPSELSGGMRKRAGIARALALDPDILFLDEPTAGLDPIGAAAFDDLVRDLGDTLGLTVVMVTHDLDTLYAVCDRVAVLIDRRLVAGTLDELVDVDNDWIHEYFHGPRSRIPARTGG